MKVVFLDVDGVLNNFYFISKCINEDKLEIDENTLILLKDIIDETKASIVLSSCWKIMLYKNKKGNIVSNKRKGKLFLQLLEKYGLKITDITPKFKDIWKEKEIGFYLFRHPEVEKFIILDDEDFDLHSYKNNLIKTNWKTGLTEEERDMAIRHLNRKVLVKKRNEGNIFRH